MEAGAHILLINGAVVITAGLLSGVPYGIAVTKGGSPTRERSWRVAHSGLTMGGIAMVAIAGVADALAMDGLMGALLVWSFVASGYGFVAALPLRAWADYVDYYPSGKIGTWIVAIGSLIGMVGSLVGALCLLALSIGAGPWGQD